MAPLTIAMTALQSGGKVFEGIQANEQGKAAQDMANYDAMLMERQAKAIEQKSRYEQTQQANAADRQLSSMKAAMGASGVSPTSGSGLSVLGEQASQSEAENQMIGFNYGLEAQAARSQGQNYIREGKMARARGKNAMLSSFIGSGTSLISGFEDINRNTDWFKKKNPLSFNYGGGVHDI